LDGETPMNTNGRTPTDERNMASSFAGLTHDVIELAELQAQLFTLDIKNTSKQARTSLALVIGGVCLLLGTIPVLLATIAAALNQYAAWSWAASLAMATVIGIAGAGTVMGVAWSRFRSGIVTMERSREEFNRNVAWVKTSLRRRAQASSGDGN